MKPFRSGPYDATFAEREMIRLVYEGEIKIDEYGRIWRMAVRYNNGRDLYSCEPRRAEHRTRNGYLEFRSMRDGERKYVQAHRLVWQYFHGDIPQGQTINHINGVVYDNRPNNLELATMSEQNIHAAATGANDHKGEKNSNASLTKKKVAQIKLQAKAGVKLKDIAMQFGVSAPQISRIVRGKSWQE